MRPSRTLLVAALVVLATLAVGGAHADEAEQLRTFYFGNSFTGNAMPGLHPLLGKSVGKQWAVQAAISPGVPIWAHMKRHMDRGADYERFHRAAAEKDAIVLLVFGGDGLSSIVTEKWQGQVKFDRPTDIGDVAACSYLIREYLKLNPQGRAYVYTAWPGIPEAAELRRRVQDESRRAMLDQGLSREEVLKKVRERKLTHDEMEPLRRSFDYAAAWLNDYDPAEPQGNTHTRAHMYAVMEGLKKNFPELWSEGRLGMIPMGDVFLELDRRMRAGDVPGIGNIGEFSADGGHLRSGLPRYTLAAAYYAVLFRRDPGELDWSIFQDRGNYESMKHGFYVHQPDLAVHLDITPARAKVVNDTIWAVVREHPYTHLGQEAEVLRKVTQDAQPEDR